MGLVGDRGSISGRCRVIAQCVQQVSYGHVTGEGRLDSRRENSSPLQSVQTGCGGSLSLLLHGYQAIFL
jgi:hypothetical protein